MINLLANVLPNLLLPEDAKSIDRMRHTLKTDSGCMVDAKRKGAVAPAFGIIKHVLGFRRIFLRGLEAVAGERTLVKCRQFLVPLSCLMKAASWMAAGSNVRAIEF